MRRDDINDPIDILVEGYKNTFDSSDISTKVRRPSHVQAFLDMAGSKARIVNNKWGIPASVLLAQSAIESGWGRAVKDNAYFGIKGKSPSGESTAFKTTEVINGKEIKINDSFRAYVDYEESADDYGRFLNENPRYSKDFDFKNNPKMFAKEVASANYATDPNYEKNLFKLWVNMIFMNMMELTNAQHYFTYYDFFFFNRINRK